MFYINDNFYDEDYIEDCFIRFDENPIISQCAKKRLTVCLQDSALWVALCLYIKQKGGSVFPLPVDTPIDAARRRAQISHSDYLLFGFDDQQYIEAIDISAAPQEQSDSVLIQMSSGTTGNPKVIERTWDTIDLEIDAYRQHFTEADTMTPVIAAPISHSYGLVCGVLVAFKRSVTPIVITNLNPKYISRKLREVDQAILYSSPALISTLTLLLKSDQMIHAVMTSGTLMQEATFSQVKNKTRHLYQQYGCSEAGCISLGKNISHHDDIGTPLPHHCVSAGEQASAPKEILTSSGGTRFFTQDLAYFDDKGSLRFVSRIDDMINVAGLNVYPTEVENIILTMPRVSDAVVFKRKHSLGNDQICLNFVASDTINPEDIRRWCRDQLALHQIPMHIKQVDKINKLPNGKINRKQLAESI